MSFALGMPAVVDRVVEVEVEVERPGGGGTRAGVGMVYDETETEMRVELDEAGGNGVRSSSWDAEAEACASANGSSTSGMGRAGAAARDAWSADAVRSVGGGGGGARRLDVGMDRDVERDTGGPQEPADMVVQRGRLRTPSPVLPALPPPPAPAPAPETEKEDTEREAGVVRAGGASSYVRRGAQTLGMRFQDAWAGLRDMLMERVWAWRLGPPNAPWMEWMRWEGAAAAAIAVSCVRACE